MVYKYGIIAWRRRSASTIAALTSRLKFHGSLPENGELDECSRLIGLNAPSWYQRASSSLLR